MHSPPPGEPDCVTAQVGPVFAPADAEGLTEFPRPVAQVPVGVNTRASRAPENPHALNSLNRLHRAQENRATPSFPLGHDIAAEVHPVREVDVEMPPFTEHDFVPGGHAAVCMAGRIPFSEVGLDFDDAPHKQPAAEPPEDVFPREIACDRERGAEVERAGEPDV